MKRDPLLLLAVAVGTLAAAPALLRGARPGLWEIGPSADGHGAQRRCIADIGALVGWSHRGHACRRSGGWTKNGQPLLRLQCGRDFGEARGEMLTPRTARIEAQGIRDGLPYAEVWHARRLGPCR